MSRSRSLLVVVLLASTCAAAKRLPVRVYTTSDGLALDGVGCVVQDSGGFLWFCTEEGLSRFDGYAFTNYTTADGLPSNRVFDFLETRNGVYWIATSRGLCRLVDPRDSSHGPHSSRPSLSTVPEFVKYDSPDLVRGKVTALAEGPDGTIWCGGAHRSLYRMDGNRSDPVVTAVSVDSHPESAGSDYATSLVVDRTGAVWMGTLNGLYRYDPGGRVRHYTVRDGLPENAIHSLFAAPDGRLWIGTGLGLCRTPSEPGESQRLVERVYTTRDGLPANWINVMLRSLDGDFWIGTGLGLAEFVPNPKPGRSQFRNLSAEVGVVGVGVDALAEDREGNLWLGTGGRGAVKIVRNGFSTYGEADGLPLGGFGSVFEDRIGELCLFRGASSRLSLHHFDGERFGATQLPLPSAITYFGWGTGQTAFQDHTGEWWIATGQGLCRFSRVASVGELGRARLLHVYTTRDGLEGNDIFCIFEDSHGDIWISTTGPGNLARWERKTNSIHDWAGWPPSDHGVSGFAEDSAGDLWMSLWQGGFLRYRGGRLESFPPGGELPPGLREGLLIDRKGRLWAGGYAGLCRIDRPAAEHPQFVTYGPAQGLSSTFVSSVAEGQQGDVFVATARGVDRLEPESGRIRHYTAADGLAPGQPYLLFSDRRGALWVISKAEVSQLVLQAGPRRSPPSVLITGLRVRGLSFPISARGEAAIAALELKPSENQLTVDFVSPSFAAGEALRYQFLLAGADRDWSTPADQRTVNYASLSPGSYRFLVRAIRADGLATPDPAVVSFRILPPIWLRSWFLALAATLVGLAAYAIYRYRLGHLLELERVRTRIATDLHDDIGTSLSGMAFLSEAVRQQIGESHSEASEMAGEVAATARGLADALGDVVWSIDPRRDDLGNLIVHVRRFASRVLEAQGIAWRFQAPPEPEKVKLAPEQRRHLLLIFKEAINNIARHAHCASATIAISVADHRLEAEIEDDGRGFDPRHEPERPDAHAGGNGLGNLRLRAAQLGGHLDIDSTPGSGTRLKLTVPLPHVHAVVRTPNRW